jgi:hypothetical protein
VRLVAVGPGADLDPAISRVVVDQRPLRVVDQVQHHLLELGTVGHDRDRAGREVQPHLDAVVQQELLAQLQDGAHDTIQVHRLARRLRLAGELEEAVHDARRPLRAGADGVDVLPQRLRVVVLHEVRRAADHHQRIADLVRHAGHQLADGGEPRGVDEPLLIGRLAGEVLGDGDDLPHLAALHERLADHLDQTVLAVEVGPAAGPPADGRCGPPW